MRRTTTVAGPRPPSQPCHPEGAQSWAELPVPAALVACQRGASLRSRHAALTSPTSSKTGLKARQWRERGQAKKVLAFSSAPSPSAAATPVWWESIRRYTVSTFEPGIGLLSAIVVTFDDTDRIASWKTRSSCHLELSALAVAVFDNNMGKAAEHGESVPSGRGRQNQKWERHPNALTPPIAPISRQQEPKGTGTGVDTGPTHAGICSEKTLTRREG